MIFPLYFFSFASSVRTVAVVVIASFLLVFFLSATRKKVPSNGDGNSNSNSSVVTATAIVVTLVDFSVCMSGKGKIAQFIVSSRERERESDTLVLKNIFWRWCAFFHFFFFFLPLLFSLSIIIMIFEVSTASERYCTFRSGMPNSMAGLYVNKYKYFIHGKCARTEWSSSGGSSSRRERISVCMVVHWLVYVARIELNRSIWMEKINWKIK